MLDPLNGLAGFPREHLRRIYRKDYHLGKRQGRTGIDRARAEHGLAVGKHAVDSQRAEHLLDSVAREATVDFVRHNLEPGAESSRFRQGDRPLIVDPRSLNAGFRALTEYERQALILRDIDGLALDEVARLLGWSKAAARRHIGGARTKIRISLAEGAPSLAAQET